MWERIATSPVNMLFHRVLWLFIEIYEKGYHITIPNFISQLSPLKFLYFTGFPRFMVLTEYHIEYHGDEFRIKFYTTFNASATKSISLCFSSSVIWTYRFMVIPMLEWPKIFCRVLGFIPPSMHLVAKVCPIWLLNDSRSNLLSFEIFSHLRLLSKL